MKSEKAFKEYLTAEFRSTKTNAPYSVKVASDIISRCRRVERVLGLELSKDLFATQDLSELKLKMILASEQFGSSAKRPHAYLQYFHSLKAYYIFTGGVPARLYHRKEKTKS